MKKRPINRCLFPILLIFIFFIVELYILGESKKEMLDAADKALVEAVDIDLKNRWEKWKELNKPVYFFNDNKKAPKTWPRIVKIVSKKGVQSIVIDTLRDLMNINDFQSGHIKREQQSIIRNSNPIVLDTLQYLFEKELKNRHIYTTTALYFSYDWLDEHEQWSCRESTQLNKPYNIKSYCIGDFSEYKLDTYIDASYHTIFRYSLYMRINRLFLLIFLIISIVYIIYKWKYVPKVLDIAKLSNINSKLYKLNDSIFYNTVTYELKIENKSITLRQQLGLLLSVFVESPNHEVSVNELRQKVWKKSSCTNETLSHAISCLRKYFPEKTQIKISKIDMDKYKLIIKDDYKKAEEIE